MPIPLELAIYRGQTLVRKQRFEQDLLKIGRVATAQVVLDAPEIGGFHAVIEASFDGNQYNVIDMGTELGTMLNGVRVTKERLRPGDELRFGEYRVTVDIEDEKALTDQGVVIGTGDLMAGANIGGAQGPGAIEAAVEAAVAPELPEPQMLALDAPTIVAERPLPAFEAPSEHPMAPRLESIPLAYEAAEPRMAPAPMRAVAPPPVPAPAMVAAPPPAPTMVAVPPPAPTMVAVPPPAPAMVAVPRPAPAMVTVAPNPPMMATGPSAQRTTMMPVVPINPFSAPRHEGGPTSDLRHGVPNNLAMRDDPDTDRALEIKTIWGDTVLDTINVTDQPSVSMGDQRKLVGWGPFAKVQRCDVEIPTKGMTMSAFPVATSMGPESTNYVVNVPQGFEAWIETARGEPMAMAELPSRGRPGLESSEVPGASAYTLQPEETLFMERGDIRLQLRYVKKTRSMPMGIVEQINPVWANTLLLVFFVHLMAIIGFATMPERSPFDADELFKNPSRFAQYKLTPEEKKRLLAMAVKNAPAGEPGARHKGEEGKAGRKDYKGKKQGRMAIKGDPSKKDLAKSMLTSMFGVKGNVRRSYLFGSGGLGGELKSALGGVVGAEIGDATGMGGLGLRGSGPGGGGLSSDSVGIGALGTRGRGGGAGGSGYGDGAGRLGRKAERDINISAGSPIVMGSLDKELIRRVIQQHIAQIRYCYERELQKSPGLFGKVASEFVIGPEGEVQTAKATENSLNAAAASCMMSKIRTWQFPKPKGGGVVIVKYPFLFKTAG